MKCPHCQTDDYYLGFNVKPEEGDCANLTCQQYSPEHREAVLDAQEPVSLPPAPTLDLEDVPDTKPGGWRSEASDLVEELLEAYMDDKTAIREFYVRLSQAATKLLRASTEMGKDPMVDHASWCAPRDCSLSESRRLSRQVLGHERRLELREEAAKTPSKPQTTASVPQTAAGLLRFRPSGGSTAQTPAARKAGALDALDPDASNDASTTPAPQSGQTLSTLRAELRERYPSLWQLYRFPRTLQSEGRSDCSGRSTKLPRTDFGRPWDDYDATERTSGLSCAEEDRLRWYVVQRPGWQQTSERTTLSVLRATEPEGTFVAWYGGRGQQYEWVL